MQKKAFLSFILTFLTSLFVFIPFTGCTKASENSKKVVEIHYLLWDSTQFEAYDAVADVFMEKHPDIKIVIEQINWANYWDNLNESIENGTAPDVFTNHTQMLIDLSSRGELLNLNDYIKKDNVDRAIYINDLGRIWILNNSQTYALPKDWDTIAIVYNKNLTDNAGITSEILNNLTWNPKDGGTFERILKRLTIDVNGNNALSPNFDKNNIYRYGMALDKFDHRGQCQYSSLAYSNGWTYSDGLYDTNFKYDDKALVDTIKWFKHLVDCGYMMNPNKYEQSAASVFADQKAALTFDGSWLINSYKTNGVFDTGFARMPAGPYGTKSMMNALGDSIWSKSPHKEQAWEWVKYLASEEAQNIIAKYGTVFPAVVNSVDKTIEAFKSKDWDVSCFVSEMSNLDELFFYPVVGHTPEIEQILTQSFNTIFTTNADVEIVLKKANKEVNNLFIEQ